MLRRISCDWFLTDDILPAVRLETPETVTEALRHAGLLAKHAVYTDFLQDEWVCRRKWRYSAVFAAEAAEGRRFLSVSGLHGSWQLLINGTVAAEGSALSVETEITPLVRSGENRLELRFAAPDCEAVAPRLGFNGMAALRETGSVVIHGLQAAQTDEPDGPFLEIDLEAQADCDARLHFALKGGPAPAESFVEQFISCGRHRLRLAPFGEAALPRAQRLTIALSVLLDGRVSDERMLSLCLPALPFAARGLAACDEFTAAACAQAGGNALLAAPEMAVLAADHALTLLTEGDARAAAPAMDREELLSALTDGDLSRLDESAAWRLTRSAAAPDQMRQSAREFGPDIDDWAEICRLSRYRQAEKLRLEAEDARLNGESFLLKNAAGGAPCCASTALFDADDCARPAFAALADAWKSDHAFVRAPAVFPEDGIINIPIYYIAEGRAAGVTINAIALRTDGQELVSATFPAAGREGGLVGRLCTELPEDEILLLRTRVLRGGQCVSVSDRIICTRPEKLRALAQTQLLRDGNTLKNVGSVAAVGVSAPDIRFYGTLLPGETLTLSGSSFAEGLNIFE